MVFLNNNIWQQIKTHLLKLKKDNAQIKTHLLKSKPTTHVERKILASNVPNLGLDNLLIDTNTSGSELDPNGGFRFEAKLVLREPGQQIQFAHTGVPDQNHLEQVIVIIICSVRAHSPTQLSLFGKKEKIVIKAVIFCFEF